MLRGRHRRLGFAGINDYNFRFVFRFRSTRCHMIGMRDAKI